jgi:FkbM family methyltransferase
MINISSIKKGARWSLSNFKKLFLHLRIFGFTKGIVTWFTSEVLKRRYDIAVKVPNFDQSVILRAGTTDIEVYKKIFLDREYQLPFQLEPRGILDLGANTGLASIFFQIEYPNAIIVSVEPDPDNFAMLKKQVGSSDKILCIQAAVWPQDGRINLIDPGIGSWGMQVSDKNIQNGFKNTVAAISISTLLEKLPEQRCDLLKVDIEGAEREVFSSGTEWIDKVQAIVLELHDKYKPGCSRAVFNLLRDFSEEKWIGENVFIWRTKLN